MSVFEGISLPTVIYRTRSNINGDIEVLQDGKTLRLKANKITQSINPDSPLAEKMVWGKVINVIEEEMPNFKKILILGMGGGTVQHLVSRRFPGAEITSVDVDRVMVETARQFFHIDEIPNHRMIVDDACRVVITPEEFELKLKEFDILFIDIYIGSEFPELGKSGNFLASACKLVKAEGLVIVNRIYFEEHQEDVDIFIDNISQFLKNVKTRIIPGKTNADNMLIYGRV